MAGRRRHVRFALKSRHRGGLTRGPLRARSRSGRSVSRLNAPLSPGPPEHQVIAFETLVSTLLILPPTLPMAVIAATALSEATVTDGDTIKLDCTTCRGRLGPASGGWT